MQERVPVLAVDDRPLNLSAIEAVLEDQDVDLVKTLSGPDALRHTLTQDFALVLLDVQMPGMDGFETAELMRANPKTRHLPIIFVTAGMSETALQFKGYELGAVDYLIKPFAPHILRGKVNVFCQLYRQRRELEAAKARLEATVEERVEQLRESEERFRLLATQAPVGIYQFDRDGNCVGANPCWYAMCGLTPKAAAGQGWRATLHPDDQPLIDAAIRHAFANDMGYALEYRIVSGSRTTRTVLARAEMSRDHEGRPRHLFGTVLDITDRKTAENEMMLAKAEAERANEAKSRFLAAASHDLRQPLGAMTLYLDVLQKEAAASNQPLIGDLRQCVGSLSRLLTDLLDMSKLEAGVVRPTISNFRVNDLLASLLSVHAPEARLKGLWLSYVSTRLTARTDAVLFQRMLGNLIANAVRYTEQGRILVGCRRRGGKAWVEVWDTGIGIPADKTSEIFEEFKQLGDGARTRGSGLGLAIVAKTAALLGLQIRVNSRLGGGSMFALELPLGEASAQPLPQRSPQRRSLRIALVEDNRSVLLAVKCALESVGHEVIAAESGRELVEALAGRRPDVVLSDYRLTAGETALDVIDAVRELHDNVIPALVMTGETAPSFIRDMADRGLVVQHKPLDLEALQLGLASIVTTEAGIDPLTGVWNLRRLEDAARHALRAGQRREQQAPSLIVFGIDCFQDLDSELGSQRADDVLREVARRAGAILCEGDALARRGGALFLVLAKAPAATDVETLAEDLRRAIESAPFAAVGEVSASFGVAEHLAGEPYEEWLARADDALHLARNSGGNCVRLHPANRLRTPRRPIDGQFIQLVWREHYCCGEPTIDAQHQALFEQANALLTDLLAGRPAPELALAARQVLDAIARHCRDEERVLEAAGYPHLDRHRADHAALLRKAENVVARIKKDAGSPAQLIEFLTYGIIGLHMLGTDREYAAHLRAFGSSVSREVA